MVGDKHAKWFDVCYLVVGCCFGVGLILLLMFYSVCICCLCFCLIYLCYLIGIYTFDLIVECYFMLCYDYYY